MVIVLLTALVGDYHVCIHSAIVVSMVTIGIADRNDRKNGHEPSMSTKYRSPQPMGSPSGMVRGDSHI